ncbi:cyclophilin peptidyl-prolyl cis-trans isomerase Cyp8 [Entomophthora muscae]|uniref:Cyclophilin peptidyl-prolyl cis-trans isomerase Cyp8 n=2 Tax=Entomophthora muscae TaxID=34485 RepID=A0ACC2SSX9_9FUNG|nr:cyclophilin peptidyl-prolyl cis-trans isomerase Cyp8 [Entomophthora muscae]
MGKWTDKLYITHGEWANEYGGMSFGGVRTTPINRQIFRSLPFNCCALSLQEVELPYCTDDGIVFDLENILPYMKKYGSNPVTGGKLEPKDLFKIEFTKNKEGQYCCPITFKIFTEHTHIVAIRTSGKVYAYDAVEKLNIRAEIWNDLITDQPFTKKDVISIQDPHNLEKRNLETFQHLKKQLNFIKDKESTGINLSGSARRILEASVKKAEPIKKETEEVKAPLSTARNPAEKAAIHSLGKAAASLTSTSMTPVTVNQTAMISDEDYMFQFIKTNGFVRLTTNFGDINLELFCPQTPRACYNFIMLARSGYYDGVKFHRSIKNFMIQGGDPSGTGKGGESIWKKDFANEIKVNLSHDSRGMLCMANRGKNTNSSQFYITYRPCKHLDGKHTVFGKLVGGMSTLDRMEKVPTDEADLPTVAITIQSITVFTDPFADYLEEAEKKRASDEAKALDKLNKKPKDEDVTTFFGSRLVSSSASSSKQSSSVGKYLKPIQEPASKKSPSKSEQEYAVPAKKPKTTGSYGNFSNW